MEGRMLRAIYGAVKTEKRRKKINMEHTIANRIGTLFTQDLENMHIYLFAFQHHNTDRSNMSDTKHEQL